MLFACGLTRSYKLGRTLTANQIFSCLILRFRLVALLQSAVVGLLTLVALVESTFEHRILFQVIVEVVGRVQKLLVFIQALNSGSFDRHYTDLGL